ncbi:MAG: hypothetical protein ACF788_09435, partial [Novipirellula sp. JB048]
MSDPTEPSGLARIDGIRRVDASGEPWVDALAGRASAVGFGCPGVIDALAQTATTYWGDASAALDIADEEGSEMTTALRSWLESSGGSDSVAADSLLFFPAVDLAIEAMIA